MSFGEHRWQVPARPAEIGLLRHEVTRLVGADGLSLEQVADVALAVSEAATNAVRHGYPHGRAGTISLEVLVCHGGVRVTVADDGVGLGTRSADPGAGLGLTLIHSLADEVLEQPASAGGAQVQMTFRAA